MSKNNIAVSTTIDPSQGQEVKIDLTASRRDPVNIGMQWLIHVEPTRSMFNIFGSRKKIDREISLTLENLVVAPELVVDRNRMLSVMVNGRETVMSTGTKVPVHIKEEDTAFLIFFKTDAVNDCTEIQSAAAKKHPITFNIVLRDEKGSLICNQTVLVEISLRHLTSVPSVLVKLNQSELMFNDKPETVLVGELVIRNDNDLAYLPSIDCDCEMVVKKDGEIVSPGLIGIDLGLCESSLLANRSADGTRFSILNLDSAAMGHSGNKSISIPIRAHVARIGNPCDEPTGKATYEFNTILKYRNSNEPEIVKQLNVPVTTFSLLRNSQRPSLKVLVEDPQTQKIADLTEQRDTRLERVYFLPGSGLQVNIPVTISNLATEGRSGAGIVIRNIEHSIEYSRGTEAKYTTSRDDANTAFMLEGPTEMMLPNRGESTRIVNLIFSGDRIKDLYIPGREKNYNVDVKLIVSFDYCLDEQGLCDIKPNFFDDNKKTHKIAITLPVFQQPNPEWLAIDFGTSAIVSQYGNTMLDLHKQKNILFNDPDFDTYEVGTPFLSSNLIFREIKSNGMSHLAVDNDETTEDAFKALSLCLSPHSELERANIRNVIPCLKLIVGYDLLPNIENYANFSYSYKNSEGEILEKQSLVMSETDEDGISVDIFTPLARVDNIFGEVYKELFSFFISKSITGGARRINQLVLTVPNTYTPLHMQRIREIVTQSLRNINIRTIRFVSESDAVACYYQHNWLALNRQLGRENNIALKRKEYVLVYDMGAGTLDVTLFAKETIGTRTYIRILGKIGIAKAGNYLDALIAQLLAKWKPELENFANPDKINDADRIKAAFNLKAKIKNVIKPALSEKFAQIPLDKDLSLKITKDTLLDKNVHIINTPEFQNYLKEVTEDFLSNFFEFFSNPDEGDVKIDTVLMSGRSAKLKAIQERLDKALKKWAAPDMKIIDLSTCTDAGSRFDRAKTVVVEGAINYASLFGSDDSSVVFNSPNIVAAYGVIYRGLHGETCYRELLNPRHDQNIGVVKKEGMNISTYRSKEVTLDLSSTSELILVQTFSANTEKDWQEGNHEYITPMVEINATALNNRKAVRLQLLVDENNTMSMLINGMQRAGISTSKIDINSKSNRFSLWPVLKTAQPQ